MKYSMEYIVKRFDGKGKLNYIFFWRHAEKVGNVTKACLSQWYPCEFQVDGVKYFTTEQFMMAQKAMVFHDTEIYNQILAANHPKQFKELGRKIKNFSESEWEKNKYDIVLRGNVAKFSQNEKLKKFLINTSDYILVEASPYDTIWGIGKEESATNIKNPHTWKGQNLLGFALMEARDLIQEKVSK